MERAKCLLWSINSRSSVTTVFLSRDAIGLRNHVLCLHVESVRPSVRLSHSCVMSKRVIVSSNFIHYRVSTPFWFSRTKRVMVTKSNSTRSVLSNSTKSTECRKDVRHSDDKNHPLSTKSTELNMFNFGDNVDRNKLSNSTSSPVITDERLSRKDFTSE